MARAIPALGRPRQIAHDATLTGFPIGVAGVTQFVQLPFEQVK